MKTIQNQQPLWKTYWNNFLSFLFPPLCLSCAVQVRQWGEFCPKCWGDLVFVTDPLCSQCGSPFDFMVEEGMKCGKCIAHPPHYDRVRSIFIYNDVSKKIILKFKHHDTTHLAKYMAQYMEKQGDLFYVDMMAPIPLHWKRLLKRKFNQSALIMHHFGEGEKVYDLLLRSKETVIQGTLGEAQRIKNVKSAFKVNPKYEANLKGKTILLIDDVFTTGATVNECAKILKKKGAKQVFCLVFARAKN